MINVSSDGIRLRQEDLEQMASKNRNRKVLCRRSQIYWLLATLLFAGTSVSFGEEEEPQDRGLHRPVYRVSKAPEMAKLEPKSVPNADRPVIKESGEPHPLDPALVLARETLQHIEDNIRDYTCILVKRERIGDELIEHEFMSCKIRHKHIDNGQMKPFSVYLGFLRPEAVKGREVLFVDGENDGSLIAHEGGFAGKFIPTVTLPTSGMMAMRNNRYPITEIGVKTLTKRLIEKGERDKALGHCEVRILENTTVNKTRSCTCVEVKHEQNRPGLDFHIARIFMDNELKVPIRYEAYDWPKTRGGKPELIEEYTYMNLKVNVGLTDKDFSRDNSAYNF